MIRIPKKKYKRSIRTLSGFDRYPIGVLSDIIESGRIRSVIYNNDWMSDKHKNSTCLGVLVDAELNAKYPNAQETFCNIILNRHNGELWIHRATESMVYQYIKAIHGSKMCSPNDRFLDGLI